ncbi:hypothetical protein HPB48_012016 [Haemaphysalis longicornis]|uniref:Uncharacterized protein n=1 Tax=Haemaphysalis longicornis TaxID=44386 RepID=A0A9J6G8D9_HAELO|nr:hypothetical protein HPB48_012016 [Haemaphysalis longicornis]
MKLTGNVLPAMPGYMLWESPTPSQTTTPSKVAPYRRDIMNEASWPDLELLCSLLESPEFTPSHSRRFIDHKLVLQLLDRFDSEHAEEWDILNAVLRRIYHKFLGLTEYIRSTSTTYFKGSFTRRRNSTESPNFSRSWGPLWIASRYPSRPSTSSSSSRLLLPLYKSECFEHYHTQRTYCLVKLVGGGRYAC